ncbi:MAG: hypothetical protein GEU83_18640 [Pseudonocardiaceae bacterium]|nr:hypothetical protein [Pseudonocardiaceae bacterium]
MSVLHSRAQAFHAAGGRVIAASDAGVPGVFAGPSLIRELELLVEAGLTPQEALVADHVGAVSPGRAADLLVVDGNPCRTSRQCTR